MRPNTYDSDLQNLKNNVLTIENIWDELLHPSWVVRSAVSRIIISDRELWYSDEQIIIDIEKEYICPFLSFVADRVNEILNLEWEYKILPEDDYIQEVAANIIMQEGEELRNQVKEDWGIE